MSRIAESELIINDRGAVYHINCRPEEIADTIILVGDPGRVKEVSKYFDSIEYEKQHREFIVHTGFIGAKRLTCVRLLRALVDICKLLIAMDYLAVLIVWNRT